MLKWFWVVGIEPYCPLLQAYDVSYEDPGSGLRKGKKQSEPPEKEECFYVAESPYPLLKQILPIFFPYTFVHKICDCFIVLGQEVLGHDFLEREIVSWVKKKRAISERLRDDQRERKTSDR